jgi:hypothetical protein
MKLICCKKRLQLAKTKTKTRLESYAVKSYENYAKRPEDLADKPAKLAEACEA